MTRILDAEARITAKDATGGTFEAIAAKMRRLTSAARAVAREIDSARAAANKVERIPPRSRLDRVVDGAHRGTIATAGKLAAAYEGAHVVKGAVTKVVDATAGRNKESVRAEASGLSDAEVKEAEQIATEMSAKYKSLSATSIMHTLRNARSIVGSLHEAKEILEPLLQLRVIAEGAHPDKAQAILEDFDKLLKGGEIKGVTQHLDEFRRYLDGIAKAVNVFGDTLRPTDYYEMFKYGRQATSALSEEFMLGVGPTLAQELGGTSTGNALSTFYQTVIGGRMKNVAAKEFNKYDLLDPKKIVRTKTGEVMGVSPGGIKNARLAAADPYRWVQEEFLPALAKKGITDPDKIDDVIAAMFRDRTAAQLVSLLVRQVARIEKDRALIRDAKGLDAADLFMAKDLKTAFNSVVVQAENLAAAFGKASEKILLSAAHYTAETLNEGSEGKWVNRTDGKPWGVFPSFNDWPGVIDKWLGGDMPLSGLFSDLKTLDNRDAALDANWRRSAFYRPAKDRVAEMRGEIEGRLAGVGYGPSFLPGRGRNGFSLDDVRAALSLTNTPVKAELEGKAEVAVTVKVEAGDGLLGRITNLVTSVTGHLWARGGPPTGSTGSTGKSMPEAARGP